jgi:hypothetical protein
MIAEQYSVDPSTARKWIKRILGDDVHTTRKNKGIGKRPYRLRRIPESVLKKHLDELINR